MYRRFINSFVVAAMIAGSTGAAAEGKSRVATIDFEKIVRQSPQYKLDSDKATAEFTHRQDDLAARAKQLQEDVHQYNATQDTLSRDDSEKAARDLDRRQGDLRVEEKDFEEDAAARNKELSDRLTKQIGAATAAVAKEGGYDLVVVNAAYSVPAIDISDEVLKRLGASSNTSQK